MLLPIFPPLKNMMHIVIGYFSITQILSNYLHKTQIWQLCAYIFIYTLCQYYILPSLQ